MLKIVGDVNLTDGFFDTGAGVGSSIRGGKDPFQYLDRKEDDFWMGNFEGVCANSSNKKGTHAKQFRIAPDELSHIKHLDWYGVANNHVMQHGEVAYAEMLAYFDQQGVLYAGSNDRKSTVVEHQGRKVGVLAWSLRPENFTDTPNYWLLPEYSAIALEIDKLSACDFRIAYLHWGNEFINYPSIDQRLLAHWLVDNGVDLVIGMHPHVLQGFEVYKDKHIFYSLGNCVFHMPWEPTKYAIVVNVDLAQRIKLTFDYIKIGKDYFPTYIKGLPVKYSMEHLNPLVEHTHENERYYAQVFARMKAYRYANFKDIFLHLHRLKWGDLSSMVGDFIRRRL